MRNRISLIYYVGVLDIIIGLVLLLVSSLFNLNLSEFTCGFCVGISIALIVSGTIYFAWNLFNKKKSSL